MKHTDAQLQDMALKFLRVHDNPTTNDARPFVLLMNMSLATGLTPNEVLHGIRLLAIGKRQQADAMCRG